jgi:hypothetical protein
MTGSPERSLAGWPKRWIQRRPTLACGILIAAVSVLSLLLRAGVPVVTSRSAWDDVLYARGGAFLAQGQWLGPFDQLTLIKNPGYSFFIALTYKVGIPLKVGEQLTYLLAAAAVAGCVWVVTRRRTPTLFAYVVLALDPVNFSTYDSRLFRDGWYATLSLLFVATVFLAVYGASMRWRWRWLLPASVLAGVSGAAFWLCREEGAWIFPTILVVVVGLPLGRLIIWRRANPGTRAERGSVLRRARRLALVYAIVAVALITPVAMLSLANSRHYGAALTNDLASGQFARAYADWRRVEAGSPTGSNPLVRSQREAVYQVSPAAKTLEPYLEDPNGRWLTTSCRLLHLTHKPCGDLEGTLVVFALRDAALMAGHFQSEPDVQSFFGELDAQIQAGCASGQLKCSAQLPAELQSLQRFAPGPFFSYAMHWAGALLASTSFEDPPTKTPYVEPPTRMLVAQVVPSVPATQQAAIDQMKRFADHDWQYHLLAVAYRLLLPCLLVTAVLGIVLSIVRHEWSQVALSGLAAAFLLGALSRLLFVALVDTTLFPTARSEIRYLLASHTFLMAFGVVGTVQLFNTQRARKQRRRDSGSDDQEAPLVEPSTI